MLKRPDTRDHEQSCACEHEETIACAPFDYEGDHVYMPPVALTFICLLASVCPFFCTVIVTCHVPPLPSSPVPS